MKPPSQDIPRFEELRFEVSGINPPYTIEAFTPAGSSSQWLRPAAPLGPEDVQLALSSISHARRKWLSRSVSRGSLDPIMEIGSKLFTWLFDSKLEKPYLEALNQCRNQGNGLRLRLQVEDPGLASLPWEFLYDRFQADFFALSPLSPIVRQRGTTYRDPAGTITMPLRVLFAMAPGSDESDLEPLLRLCEEVGKRKLDFNVLRESEFSLDSLQNNLEADTYHVLHFVAQVEVSNPQPLIETGAPVLAFSDTDGLSDSARLGAMFENLKQMRLVYLMADLSNDLAFSLAQAVPAVVGVSGMITHESAVSCAEGFYRAILAGSPLEAALTQGRQAIDIQYPGGREWGLPVLYMQIQDGSVADAPSDPAQTYQINESTAIAQDQDLTAEQAERQEERELLSLQLKVLQQNRATIDQQRMRLGALPENVSSQFEETVREISDIESRLSTIEGPAP